MVAVKVRPHEYSEKDGKCISIYRVDSEATIREPDGTDYLVLVELQKTRRPTEILHFCKYLGLQYEEYFDCESNKIREGVPDLTDLGFKDYCDYPTENGGKRCLCLSSLQMDIRRSAPSSLDVLMTSLQ